MQKLEYRRSIIQGFILALALLYWIRIFYFQVIKSEYRFASTGNAILKIVQPAFRGEVFDRHGQLIVYNNTVYDLFVELGEAKIRDTTQLCQILEMNRTELDSILRNGKKTYKNKPFPVLRRISIEEHAKMQDAMVDFPGFRFIPSGIRLYKTQSSANVLGYVSEVSENQLNKFKKDSNLYYRSGDYIGQSGLEKSYEEELRGVRGVRYVLVDAKGVQKGAYQNGTLDSAAIIGKNLYTTLDLRLQEYGDSLLQNKSGCIIAIEPQTGEVLAMVSAPTYSPSLLSGKNFSKYYGELVTNPYAPLLNRSLQARYRPGSTFKLIQALVGLELNTLTETDVFGHGSAPVKCHVHPIGNLRNAIQYSCNPYFYEVFRRIIYRSNSEKDLFKATATGLQKWYDIVEEFGIGTILGIDLPNEVRGLLPNPAYYDKALKGRPWKFSNIYSLSIGEGELTINPLKMANVAATIANRGYYITPHVVKAIDSKTNKLSFKKYETSIDKKSFEVVVDGMLGAVNAGTVEGGARIPSIQMCGKTGTSQNAKGEDSAIFIAFAPKDDPKIAIAVFIEYGGFGGVAAAPIASLMIEKYLKGKVERKGYEENVISRNFIRNVVLSESAKKNMK